MTLPSIVGNDTFNVKYYINDTISTLFVSHHECTECTDAIVDSGIVFIPDSIALQILMRYKEKNDFVSDFDLKFVGRKDFSEELFGNQDNFMSKWHDRFLIRGKVVGIYGNGGLLFWVYDYRKTYDE